ncbi:MAG: ATP-binding protein, partial [Polyangiaceae bacterium]
AEGRRFAGAHGFSVMAQWQIGIAISEIAATVLRGGSDGKVLLRYASEPREAIVVEVACETGAMPIAPADLGSVQRMMDRVALEPTPSGTRLRAWKHRS